LGTLEFPPTPAAVPLSQVLQPTDAPAGRDHLDIGDIANDFKHGYRSLKSAMCCSGSVRGTEAGVNDDDVNTGICEGLAYRIVRTAGR